MMTKINLMLVALYKFYKKKLPYTESKWVLFCSKLVFCLLIWIWLISIIVFLENKVGLFEISFDLPKSRWVYLPILFIMYFILDYFTWKFDKIDNFLKDENNNESIKKSLRLFFILLILGFVFSLLIIDNQGNTLSD